jgi:hypothetical protein
MRKLKRIVELKIDFILISINVMCAIVLIVCLVK